MPITVQNLVLVSETPSATSLKNVPQKYPAQCGKVFPLNWEQEIAKKGRPSSTDRFGESCFRRPLSGRKGGDDLTLGQKLLHLKKKKGRNSNFRGAVWKGDYAQTRGAAGKNVRRHWSVLRPHDDSDGGLF